MWAGCKGRARSNISDHRMAAVFRVFSSEDSSHLLARDSFRHAKRRRAEAAAQERPLVLTNVRCVAAHFHQHRNTRADLLHLLQAVGCEDRHLQHLRPQPGDAGRQDIRGGCSSPADRRSRGQLWWPAADARHVHSSRTAPTAVQPCQLGGLRECVAVCRPL
jgi:hypothetical protein